MATSLNTGAKPTQGLHHVAQKSTTTGCELFKIDWKFNDVPSIGAPSNNAFLHLPQVELSEIRSEGTRFTPPQEGQRVLNVDITFSFYCNSVSNAIYESRTERLYCLKQEYDT
ncbi:hypothetical protein VCHA53O464_300047 [Vibrio chagasii]|nr:hypothetical protein VCHA53O464_300047 [Vibrio chagasii]